jgi:hypothetical protein
MHRTVCDFVLDLVQNSIEAGSALIVLDFEETAQSIEVFVSDNGPGMSTETLERVRDPFFTDGQKHVHRRVGLGLSFLAQGIELAGGDFDIDSREGQGTSVHFRFDIDNIDTPPVGAVAETFFAALTYPGEHEMVINRTAPDAGVAYSLIRSELATAVGDLEESGALKLLREYLQSQETISDEAAVSRTN